MWRREGVQEPSPGEPQWPIVFWIPPLSRPLWKTDQWDRNQTSEVESQWYPVMRGWTGGSDDWQCQKWQIDPAVWGLMIWNRLLQFAGLQWLRVVQSSLRPVCWSVKETTRPGWRQLVRVFWLWMEGERQVCSRGRPIIGADIKHFYDYRYRPFSKQICR